MTPAQCRLDLDVRIQISRELGHERPAITRTYLGTATPKRTQQTRDLIDLADLLT